LFVFHIEDILAKLFLSFGWIIQFCFRALPIRYFMMPNSTFYAEKDKVSTVFTAPFLSVFHTLSLLDWMATHAVIDASGKTQRNRRKLTRRLSRIKHLAGHNRRRTHSYSGATITANMRLTATNNLRRHHHSTSPSINASTA
jgi:hypothetical protein